MKAADAWQRYLLALQNPHTLKTISKTEAALILLIIKNMPNSKGASAALILKLQEKTWSWIKNETLANTALVVLAVYSYDPTKVDGTCLAYLTEKMLLNESKVGGPYYGEHRKIDVTTNLIISRLFNTFGSPLPYVELFLKNDPFPTGLTNDQLIIDTLFSKWPHFSYTKNEISSVERTMPLLGMALTFNKASRSAQAKKTAVHATVSAKVYKELQDLDKSLRGQAMTVWRMVNHADTKHEITMISMYFARSLKEHSRLVDQELCIDLGAANFFTWMAYTIYDDFIDDEGTAALLPVANSMMRHAMAIYIGLTQKEPDLRRDIFRTFDKMDAANLWELAHCRYEVKNNEIKIEHLPAYSHLEIYADRAGAHILGPQIITRKLNSDAKQQANVRKGLRHFLIAKQLADDLEDWTSDFQKGHISAVVVHILASLKVLPGIYNVSKMTHQMQEYFWATGLREINEILLKHLIKSKYYFKKSSLIEIDGEFFIHIFNPFEELARQNELKYIHQQQFLAAYSASIEKNDL